MLLPHELTEDKAASFALAWSLSWRFFALFVAIGFASYFVPGEIRAEYMLALSLASLALTFICFWLWVHRLLGRGIGRVKIIFMEREHYDALIRELGDRNGGNERGS